MKTVKPIKSLYPRNLTKKGKNNFTVKLFMLPMK